MKKKICIDCKKRKVNTNIHHERCDKCWQKEQFRRGNLTGKAYGYKAGRYYR